MLFWEVSGRQEEEVVVDAADAARSRLVQNLKCSQITIRLVTTGPVTSFPIVEYKFAIIPSLVLNSDSD